MKTAEELKVMVDNYMKTHGMELKKSSFNPFDLTYTVTTMDYTELDAKIITMKNGNTKTVFKVDGTVASLYK